MSDVVDLAAALADAHIADSLARIDRAIPRGIAGECDECGEMMPRLVGGRCGFCRDGRRRRSTAIPIPRRSPLPSLSKRRS